MMIRRYALSRAPLFACLRSFVARGSFCPGHRCAIPYIDDVNINLTGVTFASSRIFTLSTFGSAIQARGHVGQYRASDVAIASRSPTPSPPTGCARGRFFASEEPAALPPQLHECSPKVAVNSLIIGPFGAGSERRAGYASGTARRPSVMRAIEDGALRRARNRAAYPTANVAMAGASRFLP